MTRASWFRLFAISIAASFLATAASAQDDDTSEQARGHFRVGAAYYANGEFRKAAEEFEEAHRLSGKPELQYNLYLAYRDMGDVVKAAAALEAYLEQVEDVPNRAQLQARLKGLRASAPKAAPAPAPPPSTATPEPTSPAPPPEAQATAPAPEPEAAPPPAEPVVQPADAQPDEATPADAATSGGSGPNGLQLGLMIGGGAMVVGSLVTGAMSSSALSELEDTCDAQMRCPTSAQSKRDSVDTLALVTDVLLFGGIAVAGTGALLWLLGDGEQSDTSVAAACGPRGCAASFELAF